MKRLNYILILIFILTIGIRIFLLSQKNDLFYDEVLNMTAANHNEFYYNRSNYFEKDKIYSGYEIKQLFLIDNKSLKDMFSDINNIHKFSGDILHTNLYYSIARIMFLGADKYTLNDYLIRIGGLNLILLSLSFFFMYKILNLLFNDKKYISIGLFFAFLNPAAISNTLFLREYQLQELFVILIAYLGVFYYKNEIRIKDIPLISVIMVLSLLSGYYIGYFVFCFFIIILLKKDYKKFILLSIITLSLLLCMYPQYFGFFISKVVHSYSQNAQATLNITTTNTPRPSFFMGIIKYPLATYHFICSYLLMLYFIIIGVKSKKEGNVKPIYTITILSLIWIILVLTTSPFKISRYIMPVIPLCTIILTWILSCNKNKNVITFAIILLSLHTIFVTLNTFLNINSLKFTNIKLKDKQTIIFEEKNVLPIYIISKNYETFAALITHIDDERNVIFTDKKSNIKDKHYYMCTDDTKTPLLFKPKEMIKDQNTELFFFCFEFLDK